MNPKHPPQQQPVFLCGVEDNPNPSVSRNLVENTKSSEATTGKIWYLLAFDPRPPIIFNQAGS